MTCMACNLKGLHVLSVKVVKGKNGNIDYQHFTEVTKCCECIMDFFAWGLGYCCLLMDCLSIRLSTTFSSASDMLHSQLLYLVCAFINIFSQARFKA